MDIDEEWISFSLEWAKCPIATSNMIGTVESTGAMFYAVLQYPF